MPFYSDSILGHPGSARTVSNRSECIERLPKLQVVLSDDSNDDDIGYNNVFLSSSSSSSPIPFDEPSHHSDVHWCKSDQCLPCRRYVRPYFLPVPPSQMEDTTTLLRRMPERWWVEDYYDADFVHAVLSTMFCSLESPRLETPKTVPVLLLSSTRTKNRKSFTPRRRCAELLDDDETPEGGFEICLRRNDDNVPRIPPQEVRLCSVKEKSIDPSPPDRMVVVDEPINNTPPHDESMDMPFDEM
jgi:hypothetical protein